MKLVIDVDLNNENPEKGDIITFDGKKWVAMTHSEVFCRETKTIKECEEIIAKLQNRVNTLEKYINTFAKTIKEK